MTLKKFYADSVDGARQKAHEALGQTCIIVETKEAAKGGQAWIHVLDEEKNGPLHAKNATTYSRRDLFPKALTKLKETVNDSLQLFNGESGEENAASLLPSFSRISDPAAAREQKSQKSDPTRSPYPAFSLDLKDEPNYKKEFQALSRRFDRLEKLVSNQIIGGNVRFISHPAFQQLLANGVPHATITTWFNELIGQGVDPFDQEQSFVPRLAANIKQTLDVGAPENPSPFMIFKGPAGAGKSSLIMKLALHSTLLENGSCALVTVYPENVKNYYSPLPAFASEHELAHFIIENKKQLQELKEEWSNFDHILVEMPADERIKKSDIATDDFRELTTEKKSLEVHYVINAALNQACLNTTKIFDDSYGTGYLNFTHLDAAPQKGPLLPLMQKPNCKVRYVTSGPQIPDDISRFEPADFARQLLSNS